MTKRKISPLQRWRAQYALITETIVSAKRGHIWGTYKAPAAQSLRARMRVIAREHMAKRDAAAKEAQNLWGKARNTDDPANLISV
jgi:hypothetical protein